MRTRERVRGGGTHDQDAAGGRADADEARANTDERSSLARDSLDSSRLSQRGLPLPPSLPRSLSSSLGGRGTFEDFLEEMELATCRRATTATDDVGV